MHNINNIIWKCYKLSSVQQMTKRYWLSLDFYMFSMHFGTSNVNKEKNRNTVYEFQTSRENKWNVDQLG